MCKGPEAGRIGIHVEDQNKTKVAGAQSEEECGGEAGDPDSNQVMQTLTTHFKGFCFTLRI